MNILIAAVTSNRAMSGVSRHAANLVKGLLTRPDVSSVHLLVAPWEYDYVSQSIIRMDTRLHIHAVHLRPGTLHRNLWYYRTLPSVAEQLHVDIVHIAYPSPIRACAFPCPVVVTLHDLYPYDIPSNFGFPKVFFNRIILQQCLKNANAIACVSDSTRLRLGIRIPWAMSKAITIFNCVESGPTPVKPPFVSTWNDAPFLLCVAQHRRNKNIRTALVAFRQLIVRNEIPQETRLVVVGMPGPESADLYGFVRASHLTERVSFVSGISDAELQWCYRNCELLLAPSTLEGFGLPVIEGLFAGCRIVCSDIPAFREVSGEKCRFVGLGSGAQEAFAREIVATLQETKPAPAFLPHLAPGHVSQQYVKVYQLLLSLPGVSSDVVGQRYAPARASSLADEVPTAAHF
ncbi:glycosyltransferase family 1 protein [Telmatobacter sp. DSM 110680]|uniref:Glycosyltransferase family 1 protein n=1 Tax=Telmatobacter sp. DSM 110680 TaxID=3036704 RepID=A0AAU7DNC7_9BACT